MEKVKREVNIHAAIELQNEDLLRRIIDSGCDVEEKEGNVTPLLKAVVGDNLEMVDISLAAGADVNTACYLDNHELLTEPLQSALSYAIAGFVKERGLLCSPYRMRSSNASSPRDRSWTWLNS